MSKSKDTGDPNPCSVHSGCFHSENCDRSMCLLFFEPTTTFEDLKDAIREWLRHDKLLVLHRAMPKVLFGPREPPTDIDRFVLANRHLFKTDIVYTVMSRSISIAQKEVFNQMVAEGKIVAKGTTPTVYRLTPDMTEKESKKDE